MNWTRGLFRSWLVIATIWMLVLLTMTGVYHEAVVYLNGNYKRTDITVSDLTVSPMVDEIIEVSSPDATYELNMSNGQPSSDEWPRLLNALANKFNADALDANERRDRARSAITAGLGLALIPPLLVLIIGASLLWALRGFAGGPRS